MSKYKVDDLKEPEFVLMDKLNHSDLFPFIKKAHQKRNLVFYFFNAINLLFGIVLLTLMLKEVVKGDFRFSEEFTYFSYGLISTFALIPLHEYIHALAYKFVGATNTSYDMNLRKFYFMAMADKFVADSKEFRIVILAPFVSISIVCLILYVSFSGIWKFYPVGLFFTHTLFCSGDFGLLSYLESNKSKEIYTYDDKARGESYFFERLKNNERTT
jgi:hypothetical protein